MHDGRQWHSQRPGVHEANRLCRERNKKDMKLIKGIFWVLLLALLAFPAIAATVDIQFTGLPTGSNYGGVASYPYDLSVNGGPAQRMMCIGYNEHIQGAETWQADVVSIGSLDPTTNPLDYQAA